MRVASKIALLALLLAAVLLGAGCTTGVEDVDGRADVEGMIAKQLPGEVKRITGSPGIVGKVTCVDNGDLKFDCYADVTQTNGVGGLEKYPVSISAGCDDQACTWRTV
jgi:hypothetical protein